MKIIESLVTFVLGLLVVGVVGVLAAREAIVWVAVQQIKTDYSELKKRVEADEFVTECTRLGNFDTQGTAQIRFQDHQNYTVEVICGGDQAEPVITAKRSLPTLSKKIYGDSGLTDGANTVAQLAVSVLGRSVVITQANTGDVTTQYGVVPTEHELGGPPANCASFGLTCCSESQEQGYGREIQGALDCPKSCFDGCQARPLILALNTQPFYDLSTRIVAARAGEEVIFSYVISETQKDTFADSSLKDQKDLNSVVLAIVNQWLQQQPETKAGLQQVMLDFGDGQTAQGQDLQGTFTHTYACASASCQYKVRLTARNQQGAQAQATTISSVIVAVTP